MGFKFASFGAATIPLSKIVVDKNLDLRPYGVTAAFCKAPVDPTVWPTETLDWGDIPPITHTSEPISVGTSAVDFGSITVPAQLTGTCRYIECVLRGNYIAVRCRLYADGAEIAMGTGASAEGTTIFNGWAPAATTYSVTVENGANKTYTCTLTDKGLYGGPKTFDLSEKWLALGLDMKGLAATVKIQGVEIPYEEYIKYFPIAPTELKIPGDWDWSQERPEIKVYKETVDWLKETRGWATETLDWGDIPPGDPIPFEGVITEKDTWTTLLTFDVPAGDTYKWRFTFITTNAGTGTKANFKITANEEEIFYVSDVSWGTWTFDVIIPGGSTVTIQSSKNSELYYAVAKGSGSNVQNLGFVCGPKTFDLTGKWLALGIDMHGLDAMIEIRGKLVPYTDYIKHFPVKPTKLIIPGNWEPTQERPEIKVYK